ncbi:hypothetical protein ACJRO7_023915 [Eucalyptus globulus]|uniref:Uncharacterized protein n=1 Tax=Eucalyptus globulus TaxID=34317 RepID=A0ABD3KG85_EUCGL
MQMQELPGLGKVPGNRTHRSKCSCDGAERSQPNANAARQQRSKHRRLLLLLLLLDGIKPSQIGQVRDRGGERERERERAVMGVEEEGRGGGGDGDGGGGGGGGESGG